MPFQVPPSGRQDIDGILWGSSWDTLNLTYSFPTAGSAYAYSTGLSGFAPFNASQAAAAVKAMKNVDSVCGLSITKAATAAAGNLRWAMVDQVNYFDGQGPHVPGLTNASAEGSPPDPEIPNYAQGDMWFTKKNYNAPVIGSFAYTAGVLHELGHAVGLKHGHSAQPNDSWVPFGRPAFNYPKLPLNHDSQEYSVMTYSNYPGVQVAANLNLDYPTTLMQNDIAALQYMYGADFTTNAGNTTYKWSTSTGETFINGVGQGKPFHNKIFLTIWDGGGKDTYDFSNYTTNIVANLGPGNWSTPSGSQRAHLGDNHFARGSIANALQFGTDPRSLIEDAFGGKGHDTITGNAAKNTLIGNAGNDKLFGLAGDDLLVGGVGSDTLSGNLGNDRFLFNASLTSGKDTITDFNPATDTILLENAVFTALGVPKAAILQDHFFKGGAAHDANDRVIYSPTTGQLIYDVNGSAAGGAFVIAQLGKNLAISHLDFQVI